MTTIAFQLYGPNSRGIPEDWFKNKRKLRPDESTPDGYQALSEADFATYVADRQAAYDAALVAEVLQRAKDAKTEALSAACREFIWAHYPPHVQTSLVFLLVQGVASQWTNRIGMIVGTGTWVFGVIQDYYDRRDVVLAATEKADVDAVSVDFSSHAASDPLLKLETVIATQS